MSPFSHRAEHVSGGDGHFEGDPATAQELVTDPQPVPAREGHLDLGVGRC